MIAVAPKLPPKESKNFRALRGSSAGIGIAYPRGKGFPTVNGFAELERMYEQFTLLYKEQWSMTKEKIRKDLLKPYKRSQKLAKRMERRLKKQKKRQK